MKKDKKKDVKLTFRQRVKLFFRKYAYTMTASVCGLMVVVALTISILVKNKNVDMDVEVPVVDVPQQSDTIVDEPTKPVATTNPLILIAPVEGYTVGMVYAMEGHVYNKTLNEWGTHAGIDLVAPVGTAVVASADGVVADVTYSILEGTIVAIEHTDGFRTVYKSLSNEVEVKVGDNVKSGQVIGAVSDSAGNEAGEGAHVHFEIYKDGKVVDPSEYIFDK